MSNQIPVQTKPIDYAALVRKTLGDEYNKKDVVYEFSGGKKFEDSGSNGGPYRTS
jgi:hypothetical protein